MAKQILTQKDPSAAVSRHVKIHTVDVSDTSDHTTGTTKQTPIEQILAHVPAQTDIIVPNGVIKGGVVNTGSMSETGWATRYIINNQTYITPIVDDVTHSDGDATHPRIDVTSIRVTNTDPPVPTVELTEGTPAASPFSVAD